MKKIKYLIVTLVMFFLVFTPFVFALNNEFIMGGVSSKIISGNTVFTIEESRNEFDFISFVDLVKDLPNVLFEIDFFKEKKNPNLIVDEKLEEKLDTKEKIRVIVKTNEPVSFVRSSDNISIARETSFSKTISMTGEVVLEKEGEVGGKKAKLFLDVKTSEPIEVKQIVDEYKAIEVDKKDFNQLQRQIEIGEVIIDEPFSILTDESLDITYADIVHDLGFGGEGIKICVIDTGVNAEVLGLIPEVDVLGFNVLDNSYDYSDDNGHGTNVMSVLIAFAPEATYYIVKAMDENGQGYSSDIVAGLDWCFNQEVDIYSLSIGTGSFDSYCSQDFTAQKVNEIVHAGFPVFAATGNQGNKQNVSSPACSGFATPIAASTKNDFMADFSNYNSFTLLTAPGKDISVLNMYGEEVVKSGTSLSVSMVAGIAALVLENNNLTAQKLETLFVQTGEVIEDEERKFSRINALNALNNEISNELLPREYPSYDELLKLGIEVIGKDAEFDILTSCTTAEDCIKGICIEGTCYSACNSTFSGDRCSDDGYAYTDSNSGVCSSYEAAWSCDKDEVAFSSIHYSDCYGVDEGSPEASYECDSDVAPDYTAEGICSSGPTPLESTVNCDLDEVCFKSNYYLNDCSLCGSTLEHSCDSNVGKSYDQDGICVFGGDCDTVDVCYNGTDYMGIITNCSNGDVCDSNVEPGYTTNGLVCNTYSLGCVISGSRTSGQSCCVDDNCASDNCTAGACVGGGSLLSNGESCTYGDECTGGFCIEAVCWSGCNSTFNDDRCSDNSNTYDNYQSGTCARNYAGTWSCDKDEVASPSSAGLRYTDCYEIENDAQPNSAYECDADVGPAYHNNGICAYDGVATTDVDCDSGDVCIGSGGVYKKNCSLCGYTSEYSCDSNVGSSYEQDGVCVFEGSCDTVDVCYTGTNYYGTMTSCSNGNVCDSDVGSTGYTTNGLVCNTYSLGCVIDSSRTTGQSCCDDDNCASDNCTAGACVAPASGCPANFDGQDVFEIKNTAGDVCFAINTSGFVILYGEIWMREDGPLTAPSGSFVINNFTNGVTNSYINSTCDLVTLGTFTKMSQACTAGNLCIKNIDGTDLMSTTPEGDIFPIGEICYDYRSGVSKVWK